jgi:hypothetical protein
LLEFLPQVSEISSGRVELRLTVPGPDLWTSVLTAMSVVTQAGYHPSPSRSGPKTLLGTDPRNETAESMLRPGPRQRCVKHQMDIY